MKRFFTLIALISSFMCAQAQVPSAGGGITGRISGTVIDSITKKPLDYATVSISRSGGKAILNGTLTDEKGNFKLNNVAPGKYKISVTFIGYPTKVIDPVETTLSKPDNNMGSVIVAPSAKTLSAVTVQGQAPVIENKIDKIVYNAEKDITVSGGNATDVLRKVPLVSVDLDGKPALRGDQNVRVLINGKPSGALSTSLADVLRTIPADQIKSIEVITAPSAKYDAEGSGGIINIITKSKDVSGLSGSVSGGIGTRQNNGNANLNYKQNRLSITGNLGGNFAWPQTSLLDLNRQATIGSTTTIINQSSSSDTKRGGLIGSVNAGYDFNNYNSINSTFRLNGGYFKIDGGSDNFNNTLNDAYYNSNILNKAQFSGFDWNADYTHKFKKEGEELTVAGQWSHSKINSDFANSFFNLNNTTDLAKFPNQLGSNNGINDEYTAQADYVLPINKSIKWEAGGKGIFRRINSDYSVANQAGVVSGPNNNPFVPNSVLSNQYDYTQNVYAGYSQFTFSLPKNFSLLAGARVEGTDITGTPSNTAQPGLQSFPQNYTNFVPNVTLSKTVKGTQTYKLSYSKRIQRPSLQYLNPFINKANPDNQTEGRPDLNPEISQTVELGYNTFIGSSVINVSTYYKYTNNLIEGIARTVFDTELNRNVTRTTFQNIGKNNSFGASFFGSVTPWKPLTIRGSINTFTYKPTINASQAGVGSATGTYLNYNAFLSASATITKTWTAEFFGVFNSPRRTIQGQNPAFNLFGFGVKKELIAKKFTLGLNALSPFQNYLKLDTKISSNGFQQQQTIRYPLRSFGISFTYNFGKLNYGQQKKKGVKNDDLMQGGDQGGMGGGAGQGGGPR